MDACQAQPAARLATIGRWRALMLNRQFARLILMLSLVPLAARADHLPEELQADGKAETRLAGIPITRATNVSEAFKRYGQPTERKLARNNPCWAGYAWKLGNARLEVGAQDGIVTAVYIEGTGKGPAARTGAGLRLGDDLGRIKAIYGQRYREGTYPDLVVMGETKRRSERIPHSGVWENHRVKIQWKEPEYTLTAGLDANGKIVSLWLMRPECYPGECR
jgi:hypothetical protein